MFGPLFKMPYYEADALNTEAQPIAGPKTSKDGQVTMIKVKLEVRLRTFDPGCPDGDFHYYMDGTGVFCKCMKCNNFTSMHGRNMTDTEEYPEGTQKVLDYMDNAFETLTCPICSGTYGDIRTPRMNIVKM